MEDPDKKLVSEVPHLLGSKPTIGVPSILGAM